MPIRKETLLYEPAPLLPAGIAERLAQIGGTNEYGEPLLRWEWGGAETHFRAGQFRFKYEGSRTLELLGYFRKDIRTGKHVGYEKPEFAALQADDPCILLEPDYQWLAHGHKGWHLAEWWPAELACLDHDANRYLADPDTGELIDMLGPPPSRGQYRDTGICIESAVPDTAQLDLIAEMVQARCRQAKGGWREVRPVEKVLQQIRQFGSATEVEDQQRASARAEFKTDLQHALRFWTKSMFGKQRGWSFPAAQKG